MLADDQLTVQLAEVDKGCPSLALVGERTVPCRRLLKAKRTRSRRDPSVCVTVRKCLFPEGGCRLPIRACLTTSDQFMMDLGTAGFIQVRAMNLTDDTKPFVAARLAAWQKDAVTCKTPLAPLWWPKERKTAGSP